MESQNTPREPDPRLTKIIELRQQGKNWTQISEAININRRTLYDIRGTDGYIQECNKLYESLMADIDKFSRSDAYGHQIEAMKEKGRILRNILPSLSVIQHRRDTENPDTKTTQRKTNLYNLFQYLQLTPKQWKRCEEYVTKQAKTGSHPT